MSGAIVISFDFELAWGRRTGPHQDHAGIERVRDAIDGILEIFEKHHISATWATVGNLMVTKDLCSNGRLTYDMPAPRYSWFQGEWYDGIPALHDDLADQYYAADIVRKLVDCPVHQEIASHTLTHVLIGDDGCSEEVARAEFAKCQEIAGHWDRKLVSVVFPKNLLGHLTTLSDCGYRCYRGTNSEWYWFGCTQHMAIGEFATPMWRLLRTATLPLRYLDEKLRLPPPLPPVRRVGDLWEIPHSMFFAGYSGVGKFVSASDRVAKAVRGMRRAARRGRIFHLYTHPHNFLPQPERLLAPFEVICREAAAMRDAGELEVLTMQEVTERLDDGRDQQWTA